MSFRQMLSTRRPAFAAARRCLSDVARARQLWGDKVTFSEEVLHAMHARTGIVALESTIITHGMAPPTNLDCARSVETIIRAQGATPATIALIDGKVHVGLTNGELEMIADPDILRTAVKTSRRDIAPVLAQKRLGGTTVAGTMYIASSVGIPIFVTGGIGGVHRGAESSMDISADLTELGRTPVTVVCAGAKSILDIPRTLEYLETQGVCVTIYGPKPEFPAFYTPYSGQKVIIPSINKLFCIDIKTQWAVQDPVVAARIIDASLSLPVPLSTLLAVPIPAESEAEGAAVQLAVEQAIEEMFERGVDKSGKDVSPWLLKRVGELTENRSLALNVRLIENNAKVGGKVAEALATLRAA